MTVLETCTTNSTITSIGWDFYNIVIEFGTNTIRFYFANSEHDNDGDPEVSSYEPVYHPELDLARSAAFKGGNALMIVGKGSPLGNDPDFDNDDQLIYGEDDLYIDSASYQPMDVNACGDLGTVYYVGDMTGDCYVNLADYADFASQWLWCTDPERPECDSYWTPQQ